MNNEKYNQIINEVGQKYTKWWYANAIPSSNGKPKLDGENILTRGEFINRIKTDSDFSQEWGLKIEERELNRLERIQLGLKVGWKPEGYIENFEHGDLNGWNIPTKLITVTYKDEKIEVYE
jgi:hypothetical protein